MVALLSKRTKLSGLFDQPDETAESFVRVLSSATIADFEIARDWFHSTRFVIALWGTLISLSKPAAGDRLGAAYDLIFTSVDAPEWRTVLLAALAGMTTRWRMDEQRRGSPRKSD